MIDSIELLEFQVGTTIHRHIRSWKRQLQGTIIISINNESIKSDVDIRAAVQRPRLSGQTNVTIEFGLLVRFVMSGEGPNATSRSDKCYCTPPQQDQYKSRPLAKQE